MFMSNFDVTLHTLRKFITNYLVIARLKKEEPDFPFFCWTEMIGFKIKIEISISIGPYWAIL